MQDDEDSLVLIKKAKNKWMSKTPCFVINRAKLQSTIRILKKLLPGEILYSYKTNNHPFIAKTLLSHKCGLLLSSVEESSALLKNSKIDPQKILFQSPSLTKEQLKQIMKLGISRFVLDSKEQLEILIPFLNKFSTKPELLVRINTGVKINKPELSYSSDSYLGFPISEAFEIFEHLSKLRVKNKICLGLHNHFLSQNTYIGKWKENLRVIRDFVKKLKNKGVILDCVDFGGGYPVRYASAVPSIKNISKIILKTTESIKNFYPKIHFIFEPGRKTVAESVSIVTKVAHIKHFLKKNIAILDCSVYNTSMDTLIVSLYLVPKKIGGADQKNKSYVLRGSTPDSLDVLSKKCILPELKPGDYVLFENAGAYSFWSDFISLSKPPTIIV